MKKPLLGRAGRLLGALAVGTTLFSVIALSGAVPAGAVGVSGGGVVSTRDTPDPDVVYSGHGTSYYTYSTGTMGLVTADWTNGGIGYTPLSCTSGGCGITGVTHTALTAYTHPAIPRGVDLGLFGLQAPSVVHLNSGTWVMYYGAVDAASPNHAYAVWVATATHPTATDGFTSSLTEGPIMYQTATGGSTDPSVFTSPSGTHSLQWKSSTYAGDGHLAQLWSMPLTSTGLQISGSASSLITQPGSGYWDSATIENPDMIYSGGTYYLFFSGGLWWHRSYAEGYVTCSSATGGCSSPTAASFLHTTGSAPYGPGGASLFPSVTGSWQIAYHGWTKACSRYTTMWTPSTNKNATTPTKKLAPTQTPTTVTPRVSCDGSRQLYVSQMTGLAATPLPKITSFTASPASLPATGGTVSFSVISPNMTNYSISSSPAVAGLPAERPTIHLPANTTGSPITYTFTVTTNNTAGFQTATASVTVAAKPPPPTITSFSASTSTLPANGGPVSFTVATLNATTYSISSTPVLSIPPNTKTVTVPSNVEGSPVTYTFVLTAKNASGTARASTSVVVQPSEPGVFAADSSSKTISGRWKNGSSWSASVFGGDQIATGTSPAGIVSNGSQYVFFNDATKGNELAYSWMPSGSSTWQTGYLSDPNGDKLAPGTSPTAVVYQSALYVFFTNASSGDTLGVWWLPSGSRTWLGVRLPSTTIASGSSPSAVSSASGPDVFYADASRSDEISMSTLNSGGWSVVTFPTDPVASGMSPVADIYNGSFFILFGDASHTDRVGVWWLNANVPSPVWAQKVLTADDPIAAKSNPAVLNNATGPVAFYSDASRQNQLTLLVFSTSTLTWSPVPFTTDHVATGTSPSAENYNGSLYAFFNDSSQGNRLSTLWLNASTGGWLETLLPGNPLPSTDGPAASATPSAVVVKASTLGVFAADSSSKTISGRWKNGSSWSASVFGGDQIATGTSPAGIVSNGSQYVFFNDATKGNELAYSWMPSGSSTWQTGYLSDPNGDKLAPGTSPTAVVYQSALYVFFTNASSGDTLGVWWLPSGSRTWLGVRLPSTTIASGSSPSAVSSASGPDVFYADASRSDEISMSTLNSGGWSVVTFPTDPVASGMSPVADIYNGSFFILFGDASHTDRVGVWWLNANVPSPVWAQKVLTADDPIAAKSNPAVLNNATGPVAFYSDASRQNQLTLLVFSTSTLTWSPVPFTTDHVATGTSPSAENYNGSLYAFFNDSSQGNRLSTLWLNASTGGWLETLLPGNPLPSTDGPAAN